MDIFQSPLNPSKDPSLPLSLIVSLGFPMSNVQNGPRTVALLRWTGLSNVPPDCPVSPSKTENPESNHFRWGWHGIDEHIPNTTQNRCTALH